MNCIVVRENLNQDFNSILRYSYVKDVTKSVLDKDSIHRVMLGHSDRLALITPMPRDRALKIMKIITKISSYKDFKIINVAG